MYQPVNALFDFDKGAEVSQIPYSAVHTGAHLVTIPKRLPGIILNLFHAETNTPGLWIDTEHFDLHGIAGIYQLTGMLNAFGPAHLRNVHQAFNARFKFNECAIVCHAGDLTSQSGGRRKTLVDRLPGIWQKLFVPERYAFT